MGLIDTHAHLTFPELYEQVDDVVTRASDAGVEQIITIGTTLADTARAFELAERFPGRVFVAAGFHPHEAGKVSHDDITSMVEYWSRSDLTAIGEVGLDYHYDFADRGTQKTVLNQQLSIASSIDRPLIVHSREALDDTIAILLDHGYRDRRVVFHCFTGTPPEAQRLWECGWRTSFTGVVTFKKSTSLQDVARACAFDELMLETDSPYLAPVPLRGRHPNEPANLVHSARFIAELRSVSIEELESKTSENAREFFGLPSQSGQR